MKENKYKYFNWQSLGFTFGNWEEELVWALDIPVQTMDISKLVWHLDVPYWKNDAEERWTVSPRDVIEREIGTERQRQRVHDADTSYPIDLYLHEGKYFILDGLHRLVKLYEAGEKEIQVRVVPEERFNEVKSVYSFELPG